MPKRGDPEENGRQIELNSQGAGSSELEQRGSIGKGNAARSLAEDHHRPLTGKGKGMLFLRVACESYDVDPATTAMVLAM